VHVWVDETAAAQPRRTSDGLETGLAWRSLYGHRQKVGGHLMQHGLVDVVIVGADRVACMGDVANKIGTYLKPHARE